MLMKNQINFHRKKNVENDLFKFPAVSFLISSFSCIFDFPFLSFYSFFIFAAFFLQFLLPSSIYLIYRSWIHIISFTSLYHPSNSPYFGLTISVLSHLFDVTNAYFWTRKLCMQGTTFLPLWLLMFSYVLYRSMAPGLVPWVYFVLCRRLFFFSCNHEHLCQETVSYLLWNFFR